MRAAIVGCGNIANVHSECLSRIPGVEIAAYADVKKERAEAFVSRFGGNAYASLEEMLEQEKPDVLHLCVPHYLHVPMAVYGLTCGVNVFMEKPPAMNREELDLLERTVRTSECRLGICFQNRYNPSVLAVKEMLASGEAGKVKGARGIVTWNRQAPYYTESGWRGSLSTEGGGVLINQSVHTMDLLTVFMGKPVMVEAGIANHHLKGVIEVEDTMEAYIQYENGAAVFYATTAYSDDAAPIIELSCENMTIRIEDPTAVCRYHDGKTIQLDTTKLIGFGKSCYGGGHMDCIADFYHCLVSGEKYPQELDGIMDTARLMLGAYESAREGKVVQLDILTETENRGQILV